MVDRNDTTRSPDGDPRKRIRGVLSSISEPATVETIADMADCPASDIVGILDEYEDMGVVTKVGDSPPTYKRNDAYFAFLRGHHLASGNTVEELRELLSTKYSKHRGFVEQFGVDSPDEIDVDERSSPESFETVFEWEALLMKVDDLREAYKQKTGTLPPRFETVDEDSGLFDETTQTSHISSIDEQLDRLRDSRREFRTERLDRE